MASIFSKIVAGEIPCQKVAETSNCLAFLDILPVVKGHTLVIPKLEVDHVFDLPPALYAELWDFAKLVGTGLKQAVPCTRVAISVIGLEVPHAHIHLLPINKVQETVFTGPRLSFTSGEMQELAARIASHIQF
jgi:histidine triad (HIT) family protein